MLFYFKQVKYRISWLSRAAIKLSILEEIFKRKVTPCSTISMYPIYSFKQDSTFSHGRQVVRIPDFSREHLDSKWYLICRECFKIAQNLLFCSLRYIYKHIGTPKFLVKVLIFFSPKSCISRHFSGRPNKSSDFRGNFFKNRCMSFVAMYLSPQLVLTNIR